MKRLIFMGFVMILLAVSTSFPGPGNFKKGDTWKYAFQKFSYDHNALFMYDTTFGKITFSLDSIAKKTDSTFWYITQRDSVLVRATGRSIYGSIIDTTYITDTTFQQIHTIVNDTMGYGNDPFFSFYQKPDESVSGYSQHRRKTVATNLLVNNVQFHAFLRAEFSWTGHVGGGGEDIDSSNDSIIWIDSIGLYQKISCLASIHGTPLDYRSYHEYYTLINHNGHSITVQPAAIAFKGSKLRENATGMDKSTCFFDIQGRALSRQTLRFSNHGIVVQQFSIGRCGLKVPLR